MIQARSTLLLANTLSRHATSIARALLAVATTCLLLLTALVVISSFMRYLVGRPFAFTEELVALLYMAMVFLAIPIATVRRLHISITVLPARVMRFLRQPLRVGACLVMVAFCIWFAVAAYDFTEQSYAFQSRSEQANILLWPWMAIMPISMLCVAAVAIIDFMVNSSLSENEASSAPGHPVGDAL